MFCTKDQDVLAGIMLVECDHSYERLLVTFALDLREWINPRLPSGMLTDLNQQREQTWNNFNVTIVQLQL